MKKLYKRLSVVLLMIIGCLTILQAQSRRPIDSRHPLWLIHIDVWNNADPQKIIDLIPRDVRPYVCFNLSLSCQYDTDRDVYKMPQNAVLTYKSWASVCCANNVWFTCQPASGGHTHIQDDDLNTFEYFFKHYPNFLGWNYAEQFWGFDEPNDKSSSTQASRIALFAKLVPMHHKYGGFLTISFCGNIWSHALNPVGMMKRNKDLLEACRQYPEACLWLYKYTTSSCFYNNESVSISPFISGLAKNYGVRYDNCGWNGAMDAILGNNHGKQYPTAVGYGTVLEQTCINGGAVWDGPELIWTEDFKELATTTVNGYKRRNWGTYTGFDNGWLDIYRKIIDGTIYIPTRQEVLERNKVVIINDQDSGDDAQKYAAPDDLYDGLYKQNDPLNRGNGRWMDNLCYFKSTGRYQAIPVVIDCFDQESENITVQLKRSEYKSHWPSTSDKVNEFNSLYPEVSTGDLYVSRHNNQLITYYPFSYLNSKVKASASIPLQYNSCKNIELEYSKFGNGVINEYTDHINLYLNNYRTDTTTRVADKIRIIGANEMPTYTVAKRVDCDMARINEVWNPDTQTYTLEVKHNGPLDLTINCSGDIIKEPQTINNNSRLTLDLPKQPDDYYGPLVIEAENMDYKNVNACVTNPYYTYPDVRGHSAMGFVRTGNNTTAALRDSVYINNPGEYTIAIRYMSPKQNGTLNVRVNGESQLVEFSKTKNNEWCEAQFETELDFGKNCVVITNYSGIDMYIDQVTYKPHDDGSQQFILDLEDLEYGDMPEGWMADNMAYTITGITGDADRALFWANDVDETASIEYGLEEGYELYLETNDYKLTMSMTADSKKSYTASIEGLNGEVIASAEFCTSGSYQGNVLNGIVEQQLTFSISEPGYYILRFETEETGGLLLTQCDISTCYLYCVAIKESKGGKATATPQLCEAGTLVTLEVETEQGYRFDGWEVLYGNANIEGNTFVMPEGDVTIVPVFTDITIVYVLDFSKSMSGTIPEGWRALHGDEIHSYPNTYSMGARTFVGFEGYQGKALYWRENSADYGRLNGYSLTLEPGSYRLQFANAAWKGSPRYKVQIMSKRGKEVATSAEYEAKPNANGSQSANVSSAQLNELVFDVKDTSDYVIVFANAGNGFDEFLLLECRLNIQGEQDGIDCVIDDSKAIPVAYYGIDGTRHGSLTKGINIVVMSDGSTRKVYR